MGVKIKDFTEFFKSKSKSAILILISVLLIIILIFSELFSSKNKHTESINTESLFYEQYTLKLEEKLENVVSSIDGAGECKIMVTLDTGEENIYAKQSKNQNENRDESSKQTDEYEYVVLKSSSATEEGMLLKVIEPNVRGVAIVCQGGDDPRIKENIISTVSAVLDIKTNKISITKMK